jgi:hypothetical protein
MIWESGFWKTWKRKVKVTTDFREKVLCPAGSQSCLSSMFERESVLQEDSLQGRFIIVFECEFLALKF